MGKIQDWMTQLKGYGDGKSHSDKYWKCLIQILIRSDLLKEESAGFGSIIKISSKGVAHLRKAAPSSSSSSSSSLPLLVKVNSEFRDAAKKEVGLKKPPPGSRIAKVGILP